MYSITTGPIKLHYLPWANNMTGSDFAFLNFLLKQHLLAGPVLELGGGYGGDTSKALMEQAGFLYKSTDLKANLGVDIVADFESGESMEDVLAAGPFKSVLILNVLEHTFEPIKVLDHALSALSSKGKLVVITPVLWPIHNYPIDCCRLLPDWYRRYAQSRKLIIQNESFCWIDDRYNKITPVSISQTADGQDNYPAIAAHRPFHRLWSRGIHKVLGTFGQSTAYPSHLTIGVVLEKN